MLEFLYLPRINKENIKKIVKIDNYKLVKESGGSKGKFFLSGHFSNWELLAYSFPLLTNDSMNIIAKVQASKGLNKKINEFREQSGNKIIEIGFSLKEVFTRTNKNEIVTFLVDQSAHPDYSTYIQIFGMNVPAVSGPAKIALRQRPELFLTYGVRQRDYSYIIYFEKILYDDLRETSEENVVEMTQRISTKIEEVVRKYPGEWLWFHKRFKHMRK